MNRQNIKSIAGNNKILSLFVTFQIVFLAFLLIKAFSPAVSFNVNDNLTAENIAVCEKMHSGAYKITVDYNSFVDDTKNVFNSACQINCLSDSKLSAMPVILDDAHSSVTGKLWIPFGIDIDDLKLQAVKNNTGDVIINNIHIQESIPYRYIRIVGFAILFLMIDFLVWLLKNKSAFFKKHKSIPWLALIVLMASMLAFVDFVYEGHDLYFHLARIESVAKELSNGQIPVRMMTNMLNGYGYPNSLYYCDIFLYIPALLYNCMLPLYLCYNIYLFLVNSVTVCISYYVFKAITKNYICGIFGSALYTLSAYRLLCVYTRAAVGEFTAMTFMPLVLLGMYRIYTAEKANFKEWIFLAIGMSGMILSHIISTFIIFCFLMLVCIICIKRTLIPNKLFCIVKAAFTALLLCAYFLVPFVDMSLSNQTMVMQRNYNLHNSSVYLFNLFNIFPTADGLSHITAAHKTDSLMGISIGLPLIIGIAVVILYWYKAKQMKKSVVLTFSLSMLAILLATNIFPWYTVQRYCGKIGEMMEKIQFPWRFMGVAVLLLTCAILFSLKELRNINRDIYKKCAEYLVIGIVLSAGFFNYSFSEHTSTRELYNMFNRSYSTISAGEYLLKDTDYESLKSAIPSVSQGTAVIESYEKEAGTAILNCSNASDEYAKVEVPILAYNHYCARDMLTKKEFYISAGSNNRISVEIPPMYHGKIKLQFVSPWYWRVSELLSLLTALAVSLFSASKKFKFCKCDEKDLCTDEETYKKGNL